MLLTLVNSSKYTNYGRIQWELIAKELNKDLHLSDSFIRLSKHCRERWVNHLNPEMKRDKWTVHEDLSLFEKYMEYPQKWSKISKVLKGRTDNSIKNRFNKMIKLEKIRNNFLRDCILLKKVQFMNSTVNSQGVLEENTNFTMMGVL